MTTKKSTVTRSDDLAWGASVSSGTRVPVDILFEYQEGGETLEEFLRQFPTVTRRQALEVLEAAQKRADERPCLLEGGARDGQRVEPG